MRVQRQIDRLLAQRAAEWIEALNRGERTDHAAFLDWARESKLHLEHYLETEALDRQIQALGPMPAAELTALLNRVRPEPSVISFDASGLRPPRQLLFRHWRMAAAIAVLAVGSLASWAWLEWNSRSTQVATAVGEQRQVTLPDGSRIFVNAVSRLRIDYSAQQRRVELVSGEAVFQVAQETGRPFIVRTANADVRALGTSFNVHARPDDSALVSVLEGRVRVTSLAADASAAQTLAAGEEAEVTAQRIEKRAHPDVSKAVGWREGRLYFDETPLEDIVREFNRYGGPLIMRLEGIEPGRFRFGGIFNADDPVTMVEVLERQHDLSVVRQTDGTVVIRQRER